MSLTFASTQISVWPALLLMTGWNWPLTVNCTSRWVVGKRRIWRQHPVGTARMRGEALQIAGMNWKSPRALRIESGPAYQTVKYFVSRLGLVEVHRREQTGGRCRSPARRPCGGVIELTNCGQYGLLSCARPFGAIEDEIVLKHHVPDGNAVLRDERQVAVRASDREQADKARYRPAPQ